MSSLTIFRKNCIHPVVLFSGCTAPWALQKEKATIWPSGSAEDMSIFFRHCITSVFGLFPKLSRRATFRTPWQTTTDGHAAKKTASKPQITVLCWFCSIFKRGNVFHTSWNVPRSPPKSISGWGRMELLCRDKTQLFRIFKANLISM